MKKRIITVIVTLAIIVPATIITINHFYSPKDQLLLENVAALADDPIDWDEALDGESNYYVVKKCDKGQIGCTAGGTEECDLEKHCPRPQ